MMKTLTILIALAATSLTFTATAQDENKVQAGLKAGFNLSNVYDQEGEEFEADAKMGMVAGAFVMIPIGKSMGFQPELLYSQKGFRGTGQAMGTTYEFSRTTSYFDIPLLLAFKPGPNAAILIGPHISYLLAQRDQVKNGSYSAVHDQTFNNDNPRRNTVGLTAGMDFYARPVVIGARAGWDFTDNKGDGTSSTTQYKNAWLQATIGFTF